MPSNVDVIATVSPSSIVGFPAGYNPDRLGSALLGGEDWQGSPTLTFGKTAGAGCSDPPANDSLTATPPSVGSPYATAHLQLITDPVFVQVVQGRYPYCTGGHFYHNKTTTFTASNKVWARQVVKFQANQYTTLGSDPVGANSQKLMFLTWAGGVGNRLEMEVVNTGWILGGAQTGRTFTEQDEFGAPGKLTTSTLAQNDTVQPMFTDGEWYEMILNYEIRTTGANGLAIAREFVRPITSGGGAVLNTNLAYEWIGWFWQFTGGTAPAQAGAHQFFGNRNRSTDLYPNGSARPSNGSDPFHVYYGPFEQVDGSLNDDPYNLQGTGE